MVLMGGVVGWARVLEALEVKGGGSGEDITAA